MQQAGQQIPRVRSLDLLTTFGVVPRLRSSTHSSSCDSWPDTLALFFAVVRRRRDPDAGTARRPRTMALFGSFWSQTVGFVVLGMKRHSGGTLVDSRC
ncbi:hypothetical protein CC79DRAFT_457897 [Sarocladium strictum]